MNVPHQLPPPAAASALTPLHVLVVDDSATNRMLLGHFLRSHGYSVVEAADGAQALDCFGREPVDLVLMDIMMPVMDGLEATRQIKRRSRQWVPVVFLTALDNNEDLVRGLEAGGDDYLAKPVNFVVLQAKLQALARALALQAAVLRQAESLRQYRADREAEDLLAREIAQRQMNRQGLADPRLRHWLVPAAQLSGDLLAACPGPDGSLYAMVADATGHGLPAAVSSLPALALFYSLAERGLPVGAVARDLNRHLLAIMPTGRYLCAVIVTLSPDGRQVEVWNGGMPDALALDAEGRVQRRFRSRHLALGIVEDDGTLAEVETMATVPGGQLLLTSDGILEAAGPGGHFGPGRLAEVLARAPAGRRLEAVQAALNEHAGAAGFADDVSLLLLDT